MDAGHAKSRAPFESGEAGLFDAGSQSPKIFIGFEGDVTTFGEIAVALVECGAKRSEFFHADGFVFSQPAKQGDAIGRGEVFNGGLNFGDGGHGGKVNGAGGEDKRDFWWGGYSSAK